MKLNIALAAALVAFTLLVFSPSEVFFGNSTQFAIKAWELLLTGVACALVFVVVAFAVVDVLARAFPEPFRERLAALLTGLGVAAFLQGTYLGWGFGAMDGARVDWSQPLGTRLAGIAIWLLPLLLPQLIRDFRSAALVRGGCAVLLATQSALFVVHYVTYEDFLSQFAYRADRAPLMDYSADRNAIVIVLDEFQCDAFSEVLERHPETFEALTGFTFFRNAVASSSQTFPSVPALLTGRTYDNSIPAPVFIERAFASASLPLVMKQNGVRSHLFPAISGTVLLSPDVADNTLERTFTVRSYFEVLKHGIVRSLPVWAKRQMFAWNKRRHERRKEAGDSGVPHHPWDMVVFRDTLPDARANDQGPTFKFFHLQGTHVPIRFDENLVEVEANYGRESFVRQATGVVRMIELYISRLKALEIYDNSVIVIAGDHGSGRSEDMWLNPTDASQAEFNQIKARGCPLFLAKPLADGSGADELRLRISSAPVMLTDIMPTLLDAFDIAAPETLPDAQQVGDVVLSPPRSVFDIAENEARVRAYYSYDWQRFDAVYLPPITEYIIEGDVVDDASWRTGRTLTAEP